MNFLVNTRTDWNEPPRARHQLAKALAINHHVLFISINKSGAPGINVNTPEKNITVLSPTWYIQGKFIIRFPIINEIYQNWLYKQLKLKYHDHVVINFDPTASLLEKYYKDFIYFCNDNFLSTKRSKLFLVSIYWAYKQKKVTQKALFCTGVSKYLYNYLSSYNNNSHLLLTGASFISQGNSNYKIVEKNKKVTVVYVGWLNKLNVEWIKYISKNKDYNIYLIGPDVNTTLNPFNKIDNVMMTGELVGDNLKKIMKGANVCIAPYLQDKDTEEVYTMPNKFWLYLSYGKPIVTCQINNLVDLPAKFVYQSKNDKEFIANIDKAINEDSAEIFEKRIQFIKKNTWSKRVDELLDLYSKYSKEKRITL